MNGKKIGGWIVRDGFAAEGCSSMGAGSMGGEKQGALHEDSGEL